MTATHILILDPHRGGGENTEFLLKLAKFNVMVVKNADEAFNWIVTSRESPDRPDLLLVDRCHPELPIFELIPELRRLKLQLPVLFVNRDDHPACRTITGTLDDAYCCRPEHVLSKVRMLTTGALYSSQISQGEAK